MVPVNDTSKTFLFTSESVGDGHPDKICDQISDAILDACLLQDPFSKVAVDTALGKGLVVVLGVVTTLALFDVDEIVRETLRDIGYDQPGMDLEYKTCEVMNKLEIISPCSVDALFSSMDKDKHVAGDQVRRSSRSRVLFSLYHEADLPYLCSGHYGRLCNFRDHIHAVR